MSSLLFPSLNVTLLPCSNFLNPTFLGGKHLIYSNLNYY